MTDKNKIIIDLINNNASLNEITSITGLTSKQLFYRMNMLKIKGYDFIKKYYYSGDIHYELVRNVFTKKVNEATIITSKNDNKFKALLISDLHLGNIKDRPDLLDEVYNFCAKKGINIIINAGDIIDGPVGCGNNKQKEIINIEKQIEYLLKVYPYDKNILNFICLGNHDYACLKEEGLDLHKIFENRRHDLVSLGYGRGIINVKNDKLAIIHPTEIISLYDEKELLLTFRGHSHKAKNQVYSRHVNLWIPSLTDLDVNDNNEVRLNFPSFITATISFNKTGVFAQGDFEHYIFINKEMFKVSEFECNLLDGKNINYSKIKNEEEIKSLSNKVINEILSKNLPTKLNVINNENIESNENTKTLKLSQIEKFNKKWGKK